MNKSESIVKISSALLKAQKSMGNASKDSKNPFFKSKYADLNAIREAAMPCLNDNGISVLQATMPYADYTGANPAKEYVETILLHESGEFISSMTAIVCAKPNDPQAYGSAVSYARRYGLQALVCIGAEDDDGNAGSGREVAKFAKAETKVSSSQVEESAKKTQEATAVVTETSAPKKFGGGKFGSKGKTTTDDKTKKDGDIY